MTPAVRPARRGGPVEKDFVVSDSRGYDFGSCALLGVLETNGRWFIDLVLAFVLEKDAARLSCSCHFVHETITLWAVSRLEEFKWHGCQRLALRDLCFNRKLYSRPCRLIQGTGSQVIGPRETSRHAVLRSAKAVASSESFAVAVAANGAAQVVRLNQNKLRPESDFEGSDLDDQDPTINDFLSDKRVFNRARIKSVSCSRGHVALVSHAGELFAMGDNMDGQLGIGQGFREAPNPRRVPGLRGLHVVDSSCGDYHTCIATSCGKVYSAGANMYGQLGIPNGHTFWSFSRAELESPECNRFLTSTFLISVTCAPLGTFCITRTGQVLAAGKGGPNMCFSKNRFIFSLLEAISNMNINVAATCGADLNTRQDDLRCVAVAAGRSHTAFLTANGHVYTVGHSRDGCLGYESEEKNAIFAPSRIPDLHSVMSVACGTDYTVCASRNECIVFGSEEPIKRAGWV